MKKHSNEKKYEIPAKATIGHIHLKVADLERSLRFYCDILGFTLVQKLDSAAFISAGNYHHHIGLNTWLSEGGKAPPQHSTGLYHFALRYPTKKDLAIALKRLLEFKIPIQGASDHGVSNSIYLCDPDGNGIELTVDMPKSQWPKNAKQEIDLSQGKLFDIRAFLEDS